MLEDFQLFGAFLVLHQQDALETIIDSQVAALCGGHCCAVAARCLMSEVPGLTQFEIVLPSLRCELLTLWCLCWVILNHLDYFGNYCAQVENAESVACVQQILLIANLDSTSELIVAA